MAENNPVPTESRTNDAALVYLQSQASSSTHLLPSIDTDFGNDVGLISEYSG